MPPILLLGIVLYYKQYYRIEIKIERPSEIRIIIFTPIIDVSPSQYEIGSIENLIAFYLMPTQIPTDFHYNMQWKFCNCFNVIFGNFVCHNISSYTPHHIPICHIKIVCNFDRTLLLFVIQLSIYKSFKYCYSAHIIEHCGKCNAMVC